MSPHRILPRGGSSPLLRGGKPSTDGLTEEGPKTTREAVFSEGRTPCVRKYGPYASPGISFPPHASKMTRRPSRDMCRLGPSHPCGRAEPAPPGGASPAQMALRRKARRRRERRFSRRDALRASANTGHTQAAACHPHRRINERVVARKRGHLV